mmetsp:Transcript_16483/g.40257  ORF Transcript_16483/g.40257 Transcript_16483/m.40257 type:complete len:421 (-) Transcript_16483:389-1651(-)
MSTSRVLLVTLNLLLVSTCIEASAVHKPNTIVADWIQTRLLTSPKSSSSSVEQNTPQLWMYTGSLYDPLDGRKIANIQGLECISLWDAVTNSSALQMESLLNNPNATFDDAATLRISKVFCYTTLDDDNPSLLRQIRVRPNSPRKTIPLDQSIALWETATTYVSRGDQLYVHSEWPSGEHLWAQTRPSTVARQVPTTSTSLSRSNSDSKENAKGSPHEFTVFTKRRSPKSRLFLPDLTSKTSQSSNNETIVSPKRSSLIQFGSSTLETQNKFGARETYRVTSSSKKEALPPKPWWLPRLPRREQSQSLPDTRMQYTRYGEGPPFYAPGRMCMLEMEGRPIDSLGDATKLLQQVIQQRTKGFPKASVHTKAESMPFGSFQLIPDATVDRSALGKLQYKLLQGWDKLKVLSSFQAGPFRFGL